MELGHIEGSTKTMDCSPRMLTIEERLIQKKNRLVEELKLTTEALDVLQANPEVLKILSLISKVGY